jgi:hypothetical protein
MDMAVSDENNVELIKKFADAWLAGNAVNQSLRVNRDFICEIGSPTFSAASRVRMALE